MSVEHLLAVVPVTNFDAAHAWYSRLFDADATNIPMPGRLVEWRITSQGWVQVTVDAERAGTGLLNFAVDNLADQVGQLNDRGIATGDIEGVNNGVQLCAVRDPDGNTITFIGNFRVEY